MLVLDFYHLIPVFKLGLQPNFSTYYHRELLIDLKIRQTSLDKGLPRHHSNKVV